ncbi:DNA replication and repair protein RecF [Candidatus Roizmanbacteria bacterium]|nr:DNA replication and repair protein RecF [Candidatus Roizmanbacteria bacterium]
MVLKKIVIANFRNFSHAVFPFGESLTVIIGLNAKGKTNLLESIYFICHGSGFRESKEEELVTIGEKMLRVQARFRKADHHVDFQIVVKKNDHGFTKVFTINKTPKKYFSYSRETTRAVLFSPEQITLMIGPPESRREYFNKLISFYDPEYKKRLINYESALRKRNKLFEQIVDPEKLQEELVFWNEYLEEQATYITLKRKEYADFLNAHPTVDEKSFKIEYLADEFTKTRLKESFENERRYRRTLIGPQKDDFCIYAKEVKSLKNLHHFGSRSEQRLTIFWLKLNEINYYRLIFSQKPILLLDDIFSELDHHNKTLVLKLIGGYQTVMTTTETEVLEMIDNPYSIIRL